MKSNKRVKRVLKSFNELEKLDEEMDEYGGFEKIRQRNQSVEEEEKDKKPRYRQKEIEPAPTPVVRRETVTVKKTQKPSDFGKALFLARRIESRGQDTSELGKVIAQLKEEELRRLVRRLQREVLFEPKKARLPALFAVCRLARVTNPATGKKQNLLHVAASTAAVYRVLHEGGATVDDLMRVGLAEVTAFQAAGKPVVRLEPRISHDRMRAAAPQLRQLGRKAAAQILENYLLQTERRVVERRALREATGAHKEDDKTKNKDETES